MMFHNFIAAPELKKYSGAAINFMLKVIENVQKSLVY